MHIIANHYEGITNRVLRKDIKQFLNHRQHFTWVAQVGRKFLNQKGLSAGEFCANLLATGVKLNELGILVIARMYRFHIAVVMRDWTWTTGRNLQLSECKIVLAFLGKSNFLDTYTFLPEPDEEDIPEAMNLSITDLGEKPSVIVISPKACDPGTEYQDNSIEEDMDTCDQKEESEHETDMVISQTEETEQVSRPSSPAVEKEPEKEQVSRPSTPARNTEETEQVSRPSSPAVEKEPEKEQVSRPSTPARNTEETEQVSRPSTPVQSPPKTPVSVKPPATLNLPQLVIKLHRLEDTKLRTAAPTDLKEQDPIGNVLTNPSPLPSEYETDDSSDYESEEETQPKKPDKTITTQNGCLGITYFGIKRKKKKMQTVKCPVCEDTFRSTRQHNIHMKKEHPRFKYACSNCDEQFSTYNACYKHTQKHYNLRYGCSCCEQRFQFPYQLKNHVKLHTNKGKVQCTWKGCTKMFTCNKNMFQHLEAHSDKTYECTDCDPKRIYQTYSNFRQHVKGYHGSGFKSLCGITYKWPKQRRVHQVDCDDCKRIKKERKEKPVNPNHFKDRKTWKP